MLLKNGIIHDAVNPKPYEADISIQDGKIAAIGQGLQPAPGEEVIDLTGRAVYPGFVDAHSHLGLDNYGMGFEGHDYNEMGDIVSAQLRGIDGFNPQDKSISMALHGGVTCVGTGPGSANVIGGTFFAVKTYGNCVDDMVVRDPVAMKCAFGENPKRCYREKGDSARMTTAAKLRDMLFQAREYLERKEAAGDDALKRPKFDMKMEALIPVLKGEMPLKAHAHRADDICTALRIAKEFGVKITIEHCTEATSSLTNWSAPTSPWPWAPPSPTPARSSWSTRPSRPPASSPRPASRSASSPTTPSSLNSTSPSAQGSPSRPVWTPSPPSRPSPSIPPNIWASTAASVPWRRARTLTSSSPAVTPWSATLTSSPSS